MRSFLSLLIVIVLAAPALAIDEKPTLDIWLAGKQAEDHNHPNQLAFIRTYQADSGFREAIESVYNVRWFFIEKHPIFAFGQGITRGPTFARKGLPLIQGFRGTEVLLAELCIQRRTPPSQTDPPREPPPPPDKPLTPEEIRSQLAAALAQDLNELTRQIAEQHDQDKAAEREILIGKLKEFEDRLSDVQAVPKQIMEIARELQELRERKLPRPPPLPPASSVNDQDDTAPSLRSSIWSRSVRIFSASFQVAELAALAGIGGGSFGLAGLGVWFLRRQLTRRRNCSTPDSVSTPVPSSVRACPRCKELQQERNQIYATNQALKRELETITEQLRTKTDSMTNSPVFAPYAVDHYREAFEWAARELVRKFPGAADSLEHLKSLMQQHLASKGKGQVSQ